MNIKKCLHAKIMEIGFHGSAKKISAFEERFVGIGADVNSALGLYSSQLAGIGAEYARDAYSAGEGDEATVHVLAIPSVKTYIMTDISVFFGHAEDMSTHADFAAFREKLRGNGYDSVQIETGDDVIFVSLAPERVKVLAQLTPEQAEDLDELGFDGEAIYQALRHSYLLMDSKKPDSPPKKDKVARPKVYASESLFPEMSY